MNTGLPDIGYGQNRKDFEQKHKEELGVKSYVLAGIRDTVLPLVVMSAGGAAGYFGLRQPAKWIAGKPISRVNELLAIRGKVKELGTKGTIEKLKEAAVEAEKAIEENAKKVIDEAEKAAEEVAKNGIDKEQALEDELYKISSGDGLEMFFGAKGFLGPEQRKKYWDALGLTEAKDVTSKWVGLAMGAIPASVAAGQFINYNKWKKEEMGRVAAREISQDISELELFKPSDQELVSEVKRLRQMVDSQTAIKSGVPNTKIHTNEAVEAALESPLEREIG